MFFTLLNNIAETCTCLDHMTSPEYPKPYSVWTREVWKVCALPTQPTYLEFTDFDLEKLVNVTVRSSGRPSAAFQGRMQPFRLVVTSTTWVVFSPGSQRTGNSLRRFSVQLNVAPLRTQNKYILI